LTQLARCCKPAPPDAIQGFVTRGKGVSIHRQNCPNFKQLVIKDADRVIQVQWGHTQSQAFYPVDVALEAYDRQGLLRDISEVFAKERMNVVGVQTQTIKGVAWMTFTVEVQDSSKVDKVLSTVREVKGVRSVRRRWVTHQWTPVFMSGVIAPLVLHCGELVLEWWEYKKEAL